MGSNTAEDLFILKVGGSCWVLGKSVELLFGCVGRINLQLSFDPCLNSVFEFGLDSLGGAEEVAKLCHVCTMDCFLNSGFGFSRLGRFSVLVEVFKLVEV